MRKIQMTASQPRHHYGHIEIEPRDLRWEPKCVPLFFDYFSASVEVWHATQEAIRSAELSGRAQRGHTSDDLNRSWYTYSDFTLLDNRPTQHPNPRY